MFGIFLDIETTGLDPLRHHPIELAFDIIDFKENKRKFTYQTIIKQPIFVWEAKDDKSIEINGFTYEEIKSGKSLKDIRLEIAFVFRELGIEKHNAAFICQNPAFDRSFFSQIIPVNLQVELKWPYHWLDLASMFWALEEKELLKTPERISLSKNKIAEKFNIPPENNPHRAKAGVLHLIACYEALFNVHFE